jgi:hypothetical protein
MTTILDTVHTLNTMHQKTNLFPSLCVGSKCSYTAGPTRKEVTTSIVSSDEEEAKQYALSIYERMQKLCDFTPEEELID